MTHSAPPDASGSGLIEQEQDKQAALSTLTWWPVAAIIVVCTLIELVLSLSDFGLTASDRLRQSAYEYAGFWPGLMETWRPNYDTQPYSMFATYAFLHGGVLHLVVNMITLVSLAPFVLRRVGAFGFVLLYVAAMLGGALGFGLLADTLTPMVGASGALFGVAGGILAWTYVDNYTLQENLWPILQATALLVLINVVLWWAMGGQLAWQTHLGGFVSGWVASLLIDPRSRPREPV